MLTIKLDEKLLKDIEADASLFIGKIIDISDAPYELSSHLDVAWAQSVGVTQKEMSVEVVEDCVRKLAAKAKIEVVCLVREQVENEAELLTQLGSKRIVLFK